jgi:hypothetical protein
MYRRHASCLAVSQIRSEFDDLLFRHASKCGTTVFDNTRVTELHFEGDRPVSADWSNTSTGIHGRISFNYLVDASGRNGIMSTKYLKHRRYNKALNNVACWGYWAGAGSYMLGTTHQNAIGVEALEGMKSTWSRRIELNVFRRVRMGLVHPSSRRIHICGNCDGSRVKQP